MTCGGNGGRSIVFETKNRKRKHHLLPHTELIDVESWQ
jgi:hypothetical protein